MRPIEECCTLTYRYFNPNDYNPNRSDSEISQHQAQAMVGTCLSQLKT